MKYLLFAAACLLVSLGVHAAPTPGEQDLLLERQRRLLDDQQRRIDELRNLPGQQQATPEAAGAEPSRCFPIEHVQLDGVTLLPERTRRELVAPYEGRCVGVQQLNALLKAITAQYIARGYVTSRAYLPEQDLSSGNLRVQVVEGRLEGLAPGESSGLSPRELAMAFPGEAGHALNLRELEQMVDQLNRLPSNQVQMDLIPGQQIGASQVQVNNTTSKPWRASLSRHNNGQRSTGEQQWSAALEWDSPLGLADQLRVRGSHDAVSDHTRASKSGGIDYSLPWGWWTFDYRYSQSDFRSKFDAQGRTFAQTGDSQNHSARAERVIHRDSVSKTALSAGLSVLRTNNYIDDNWLELSSNRITEAQFGFNHGRRIGNAFVNLDLGWQRGIGAFDAQGDDHPEPGEPTARYNKYTGTLSYLQGFDLFGERLQFTSLGTWQHSEDALYSPQRMSLGGLASIRGLKNQFLTGDSGGYWRNDLRWVRPVTRPSLQPLFQQYGASVGYDVGVIEHGRYNQGGSGRVTGNAFELFARGQHMGVSLTLARSLERPEALPKREHPLYFSVDFFL
ncbi:MULTISPECIES: ShlB/FhaC/HecB family hemolysin secretion/activation protein [Pseudomonas]|uniref:ShlB/FhaC/HecB family hemolysin secretion/activation protein n=1 Tax=Pseudomonas mosselii TaxID=78327 RepID=A0A5R8YUT2_9PSED|nr:ShlB/FhaC/HecB family hemolysin secretion/activation protein [Pseudomonas mosselii]TLP57239.1 ShlB/FhaC/HecB family hemolysin secretion/activation protein [Pseudomonas mosselii]